MKNPLTPIVFELYRVAARRPSTKEAAFKRNHVAWLMEKDGWYTVRTCSVTQYSPGCFRFRNDLAFDIPKRVWPFSKLPQERLGKMEITIHESEISTLLPLLVEIAETTGRDYQSPLFPDNLISPTYCWSIKANKHYTELRKEQESRRRRL